MHLSVSVLLIVTWSGVFVYLVTANPFKKRAPSQPYAVPSLPPVPSTVNSFVFLSGHNNDRSSISNMCPNPIPIINRSLSCNTQNYQRLVMSDDMLKQVLNDEGGNYVTDYMATNDDEAEQNFKNLVHLNDLYEDVDFQAHPSDWSWDYTLTKKALLDELDEAYRQFYATTSLYPASLMSGYQSKYRDTLVNTLLGNISGNRGRGDRIDARTDLGDDPGSFLQNPHRRHNVKVKLPLRILNHVRPARYAYPHDRRRRAIGDSVTKMEYCRNPGTMTNDGYYYLCSTCAHTTTLGDSFFPRIINELWCNTDSKGCMFLNHTPHGSCRQSVFYMVMLRKKPNSCMTIIKDGVHYITDEWEKYAQPIKLGCECVIDKRSPFAKYIKP